MGYIRVPGTGGLCWLRLCYSMIVGYRHARCINNKSLASCVSVNHFADCFAYFCSHHRQGIERKAFRALSFLPGRFFLCGAHKYLQYIHSTQFISDVLLVVQFQRTRGAKETCLNCVMCAQNAMGYVGVPLDCRAPVVFFWLRLCYRMMAGYRHAWCVNNRYNSWYQVCIITLLVVWQRTLLYTLPGIIPGTTRSGGRCSLTESRIASLR